MRSIPCFSPSIQDNFYLPRTKTLPPRSLERAVWPFVDEWLAWFDSYANSNDGAAPSLTFTRTKTRTMRTVEIWPPRAFYVY